MTAEATYLAAFIAGLLGGVHCLGMCGGIVGALTFGLKGNQAQSPASHNPLSQLPFLLAYNSGRILSYTLAGALMGGISLLASNLVEVRQFQIGLEVLAGLFMVVLGLYLAGWWSGLTQVEKVGGKLWKFIEPLGRRFIPVNNPAQAFSLGIFWGWLPCGLVYTILIWAIATGDPVKGALLMFSFGLGTLPMLLSMGIFAATLSQMVRKPWLRASAGLLVISFGLYTLFNLGVRLNTPVG